jgi:hypothetical protein
MDLRPFNLADFGGKPFKLVRRYYIASVVRKFLGLSASPFCRTFSLESACSGSIDSLILRMRSSN